MPPRPKKLRSRKRKLSPLDTSDGTEEANAAASWWDSFNRQQGKDLTGGLMEPGHPMSADGKANEWDQVMFATRFLAGYHAALKSARVALLSLYGRTPMVREMFRASRTYGEETLEFTSELVLIWAGYGDFKHVSALEAVVKWHKTKGTLPTFIRKLHAREENALKKPRRDDLKAPLADIPAVPLAVVRLWVGGGLWLANTEQAASVLDREFKAKRGDRIEDVSADFLRGIVSDLRLVRYAGAGRLFARDGGLLPDGNLEDELKAASALANR